MAHVELVIKMDERDYNAIIRNGITSPLKIYISDAILLPKGHKRLIEDDFEVGPVFDNEENRLGYQYVTQEDLNNAPTIIEADKEDEDAANN